MLRYVLKCVVGVLLGMFLISLAYLAHGEMNSDAKTRTILAPYTPTETGHCQAEWEDRRTGDKALIVLPCIRMKKTGDDSVYLAITNEERTNLLLIMRHNESTDERAIIWPK